MKLNSLQQLEKDFLEDITPEFPDTERTADKELEFKEMIYEEYIKSLSRKQRRELTDKKYSFSKQVKKKLRDE